MTMVRFRDVRKSFGDNLVLNDLTFSIDKGEIYGLLGPNGCGKSTAIHILCNLLDADGGSVDVQGRSPSQDVRSVIGVCPQEIALYRDLYPAENLRFFAQIYGLERASRESRIAELMRIFGLHRFARTPVASLSGGWQRRLNIAVALVHSPEVLVLDEPTAAVDLEARHELWAMIETLKSTGMTILLTTHHLDEAERLCSRIGIMKNGRIAREGTIPELLAIVPATDIALIEAIDEEPILGRAGQLGWATRRYAGKLGCLLPRHLSLKEVVDAFSGIEVSAVGLQRVSLEHAYLEVLGQGDERAAHSLARGRALDDDRGCGGSFGLPRGHAATRQS
jgi:ABC-2 type transport system ATP-binding protein